MLELNKINAVSRDWGGWRGVDTALERQIFITLRDSKNNVKLLVTSHKAAILEK